MKLLMLKGLPASGKSTYAKTLVDKGWKRINKDDLRDMLDNGKWSKNNERHIIMVRDLLVGHYLRDGHNVVVDDTNFADVHRDSLSRIAGLFGADFEVKFFGVELDEAIRRDLQRPRSVGATVIKSMYRQYIAPKYPVIKTDPALPWAVICDLDGTLAHCTTRGWYDTTGFETDHYDETIGEILRVMADEVIFVSGRSEDGREGTEKWLNAHGWYNEPLFMRASGDQRKDSIVKQEIYEREIRGKYNVQFVLDDRNQVVEMWRAQGLKVLQVADGDF